MKFSHTLLLLIFSFTCTAQVDVHFPNAGDAATQEWVKVYLDQWLQRLPAKPDTTTTTPVCQGGPVLNAVLDKSTTGLTFNWTGVNVPSLVWNVKQNGTVIRTGSASSAAQTVSVTYTAIPYGTYELQIVGLTCPTVSAGVSFTVFNTTPTPETSGRHVYMNFTGYGFDVTQATGLAPEWRERAEAFLNLSYQGQSFKGIDGIRVNVKWYEYEPSEGNFRDDKILAAVNWCIARNIKLSICLVPWRREGDNVIPDGHKATLANDNVWYEIPTSTNRVYMPSMSSDVGRTKFKNCARHLSQVLKAYPKSVDYISTTTGQTEEYYVTYNESPVIIAGYASADKDAWAIYSGNQTPPYPAGTGTNAVEQMLLTPKGRLWYEFQTEALRGFHAAFVQGVREGGGARACAMYAATGAPLDAWRFTNKLNTVFSAATSDQPDIIYSSAGDANYQSDKLMATDLNIGTFTGSDAAIEFDPDDISLSQIPNPSYGTDLNGNILYDYSASFFRRGGKIVHFAMSFHPSKIGQLAEALWKIKTQFLDSSSGMTGIEQGAPFNYSVTNYTGLQPYRYQWQAAGGSLNKQVKFNLQ
ncbi:hypothetical protein FEM33_01620 [Dyadobacter flavalbus]|uniref:Cellulase family glycosylhydrolase n=1 Tax=Dyadobacter flavalbus TaxID=2579942 RepID=A0A5M8QZ28_9BACT|nr:hypothetical protein [Dyadobacter flavalbus]KAA6441459.1 hypothetical protein FEM33_01620 [Dyadobacter flavalbus]